MPYPREYISYDTVKKLFNKNILFFGPLNDIDEKIEKEFSKYDYIVVSCNTLDHIYDCIGDNIKKYNFIRILNGTYAETENNSIKKFDNLIEIYFLTSVERINKHESCNEINPNKCLFFHPNAYQQGLENANQIPRVFAWFFRNKIKFNTLKISGLSFYMETYDYVVKEDSTEEEIEKIYELRKNLTKDNCPVIYKNKHYCKFTGNENIKLCQFINHINYYQSIGHNPFKDYNFILILFRSK